ncbi:MAG: glycosyltransferase [Ignavibacteriales bacterium]|nr:glycosyltransferase [Ignavibacteriales bacterium]
MKVLHVAPINVAGVPYSMMDMQRRFGADARLVTLHKNVLTFPEDIALNLPLPRNAIAAWWRTAKRDNAGSDTVHGVAPTSSMRVHAPRNILESAYFMIDDLRRRTRVEEAIERFKLDEYEIIHYDGGLDFFRDSRIAKMWKRQGKKIVCHYMGSDLRIRGVVPAIDMMSDLNLTNESDHLLLHPNIQYLYIPFDVSPFEMRRSENDRLRIVHSPTNRSMKGTKLILPVIEAVKRVRDVEFVLIEHAPHDEVLRIKATCDLAIEQVGNLGGTGYGRNSLETLALGIPTVTEMTPDYEAWLPENPFVLATAKTLYGKLLELIDSATQRSEKREQGRRWVEKHHSYEAVHARLMELYRAHSIV